MAKLFDQFTRYLTCYVLIHNYYAWRNAGGPLPTLSLLQPAVEASPRQTAGFIASLKAGRLVTVESADGDRRSKLLRPAPEMIREIGRSVQAFVAAGEALDGEAIIGARLLDDPDALGDLLYRSAADVLARGTLIHPFPRVLFFARRDCGYLLFCEVMRAHYAMTLGTQESMPSLSYRALAERLQVSPAHIGNLLGEADRNGWFTIGARGRLVAMDPGLVAEFEVWAACQIAHFAGLSRQTAAFLEQGAGGAAPLMTGPAS
ncbi:MAG: hypothetical protein B7X99_09350 [Rhizobiales bacterium 17-65-6]|nr:MAG: hypothetical protein B7X99_09350 [Rhizobiales bacterium 17-65-6]